MGSASETVLEDLLTPEEIDFMNEALLLTQNEDIGQLYAYRLNEQEVILGTRNMTFKASIGISQVAVGSYVCFAENDEQNVTTLFEIMVKG